MNRSYIEQLFATRNALEVMLARRAAQRATPALLRPATEAQERLEACAAKDEASGVLVANREFHMAINAIADNAEGVQLVDQRWILMRALWARVGYGAERYPGVISDHRHLITALSEGDAEAAAAIMGAHVIKAKYELLSRLAESRLLRVA
jgi:DNA-binding GntR family transcriptional regulator